MGALVTLLAALVSHVSSARELCVSHDDARASDENPGTLDKPLKTISCAASQARPGDKVIIHGGDYRETVIITVSGTAEAPIIFEAAPGETVVIKGSDVLRGWTWESGDVWESQLPPLRESTPDSKDPRHWETNDVRQVFIKDGVMFDARPLTRVTRKDHLQPGTFFCDAARRLLFVQLLDGSDPNQVNIEAARRGFWLSIYGSHIIVRGIQMRHASTTAFANWPACTPGDDITVANCTITWGDFAGLSISGSHNRLRHNLIACHGNSGPGGTGKMHIVENCRIIYNNLARYDPGWHAGGAKLIPHFEQSVIQHNEFAHNLGPGLWLDGGCNNNTVDGNFSHDNEGPGIMVEISKGNLICNNICSANRNVLSASISPPTGVRMSSTTQNSSAPLPVYQTSTTPAKAAAFTFPPHPKPRL